MLSQQKDSKIVHLEKTVNEMRQKLQTALQSSQYKQSSEIQKIFGAGDSGDAQFEMTGNAIPGGPSIGGASQSQ